jgi:hypothetical protein
MHAHQGHDYYQLHMMFVAAIWMASGTRALWERRNLLNAIPAKPAVALLFVATIGMSLWQIHDWMKVGDEMWRYVRFGQRVQQLTEPAEKVIFLGFRPWRVQTLYWFQHKTEFGEVTFWRPHEFYYSHRKGWSLDAWMATPEFIEMLRARGARYFATAVPNVMVHQPGLEEFLRMI